MYYCTTTNLQYKYKYQVSRYYVNKIILINTISGERKGGTGSVPWGSTWYYRSVGLRSRSSTVRRRDGAVHSEPDVTYTKTPNSPSNQS